MDRRRFLTGSGVGLAGLAGGVVIGRAVTDDADVSGAAADSGPEGASAPDESAPRWRR